MSRSVDVVKPGKLFSPAKEASAGKLESNSLRMVKG